MELTNEAKNAESVGLDALFCNKYQ